MEFVGRIKRLFNRQENLLPGSGGGVDSTPQGEALRAANAELTRKLAIAEAMISEQKRKLEAVQASNEKMRGQLAASEVRNEKLTLKLDTLQARLEQLEGAGKSSQAPSANVLPMVPKVPEEQRTPVVCRLLEIISLLKEQAQGLRDEIARLKGLKAKPKLRPSRLTSTKGSDNKGSSEEKDKSDKKKDGKRPGSQKRQKTAQLKVHETIYRRPENLPEGSTFKGYDDWMVQDLIIQPHNTLYRLARYVGPDGTPYKGTLPEHLKGEHFGLTLRSFVLYQYHHAHVTQPLLLEQLRELEVDISAGKLSSILSEEISGFQAEKDTLLPTGLAISSYIHVDDTGARHKGKNGYCTHVGNELFTHFESTYSKSRLNFLQILRGKHSDYVLSEMALLYMEQYKLPKSILKQLRELGEAKFTDEEQWKAALSALGVTKARHIQTATEGALLGTILSQGINRELVIMSDDAGQFNVLLHTLCWIHAERTLARLVGYSEAQRAALAEIRTQVWEYYDELKVYKATPTAEHKAALSARFDELFGTKTCFATLNVALRRLAKNKKELLLVLERPEIPLQNNLSENDIREYVTKRKISGSTRSDKGRQARDTFASLKKTCRKHGLSFWAYLLDRLRQAYVIPPLSELMRQKAQSSEEHNPSLAEQAVA